MANCLDYAKIAVASYYTGTNQYYAPRPGHMVDDWVVQHWETGTLFGNGYQGGIWQNATDVVVGCCGTNTKQKGKFIQDLIADLKIGLRILPSQARSAIKMVRTAREIANGRNVSVTGHSLGGGLAQICGVACGVPFVTFNAPAMKTAIVMELTGINAVTSASPIPGSHMVGIAVGQRAARGRSFGPGVNFTITGDIVSTHGGVAGDHIGTVVELPNATGGGAHGKANCWQAVLNTDWAFLDPFWGA